MRDDPRAAYLRAFRALFAALAEEWIRQFDEALHDADAVLLHSFAMPAVVASERRAIPRVVVSPFAAVPSGQLNLLGMPPLPLLTRAVERVAFTVMLDQVWRVIDDAAAAYRRAHGLPQPRRAPWRELLATGTGHLHLFSKYVAPRPDDWPVCSEVTGYCFLDAPDDWTPPPALSSFISSGPPPVYVGFGSMTGMNPAELAAMTRDALRTARQRAVICMGWGGLADFERSDDVLIVEDDPHEWLFRRVSAIVHHGGAGTTAAAVRAGKPSVVTPFFGDQPFRGKRLHRLGVSPAPIPKRRLTAARLTRRHLGSGHELCARRAGRSSGGQSESRERCSRNRGAGSPLSGAVAGSGAVGRRSLRAACLARRDRRSRLRRRSAPVVRELPQPPAVEALGDVAGVVVVVRRERAAVDAVARDPAEDVVLIGAVD